MAHSNSFFGLRRGSTKSLTFSVYRGQQITKDRVTTVANPQSTAQMAQRLKVPLVANARAQLKTLVNHSFEGKAYGEESLKEFASSNLMAGALTVSSYVPKGAMDCGEANFIISKGTLPVNSISKKDKDSAILMETGGQLEEIPETVKALAVGDTINEDFVAMVKEVLLPSGVDVDQLTFLVGYAGDEYSFAANGEYQFGHFHRWRIGRIIFDTTRFDENKVWKLTEAANADFEISNGYVKLYFSQNSEPTITLDGVMNTDVCMATVISSKLVDSVWRRSSQRITVLPSEHNLVTFDGALYTYLHDTEVKSDAYLNSGSNGVSIEGA